MLELRELRTEIIILASPPQVFQILCDVEKYQEWNPLIVAASGKLVHREEFRGTLVPFLWKSFFLKKMLKGFLQLNEKLKIRAEQKSK